jgi:3-hydroxyacyl-CoA dehydrogenase/enoyl-CoA hydratase/3-hydroxybutyryl-CoA epimerase
MEALKMHIEGHEKEVVDAAAIDFGMPMGPVELADVVGLDVCIKVSETLSEGQGVAERKLLQSMIAQKKLGKKTGEGFYKWEKGKAIKKSVPTGNAYNDVLGKRLLKPFLDECLACEREAVVEDADLLDAGIIFGTGFAPFRGGPMHYIATEKAKRQAASKEKQSS